MASISGKTAVVTGASSGMGKLTVERLLNRGATVYAVARRVEEMEDIKKKGAKIIKMDLTNDVSITSGVESILKEAGSVDILINNAGYGSYGAVEDVSIDEGRRQFEVNLFGLAKITQLVLPGMRKNRYGKIVNTTSIGGKIYTSFGAWYHATKHALEGWSDCLRLETAPFGIDVVIVEPGGIKTNWGIIAADNLEKISAGGAYASDAKRTAAAIRKMYSGDQLTDGGVIADVILNAVTVSKPKTRYAKGYMAGTSLFIRKWFSDRFFDKLTKSMV